MMPTVTRYWRRYIAARCTLSTLLRCSHMLQRKYSTLTKRQCRIDLIIFSSYYGIFFLIFLNFFDEKLRLIIDELVLVRMRILFRRKMISYYRRERNELSRRRRYRLNFRWLCALGLRICELPLQNAKYSLIRTACKLRLMKSGNPVIKATAIPKIGPTAYAMYNVTTLAYTSIIIREERRNGNRKGILLRPRERLLTNRFSFESSLSRWSLRIEPSTCEAVRFASEI